MIISTCDCYDNNRQEFQTEKDKFAVLVLIFYFSYRLEALNERRSGVVQMVKLAEKERHSLEVIWCSALLLSSSSSASSSYISYFAFLFDHSILLQQDVKNEAEAYMLKELSLLKWQEKATKLAHEDTSSQMEQMQENVSILEENLKTER